MSRVLNKALDFASITPSIEQTSYAIGELFCGAGGLALGAHLAKFKKYGFRHIWANDMEKNACETLCHNLPIDPDNVICGRVENLNFNSLNDIDGLAFGFPCNDFSLVGKHKGITGQYGGLYRWGVKALRHFQPSFFIAENVSGIKSSGGNKDMNVILKAFENEGYDLNVNEYKFEEYGIPQNRHRVIIIGFKKSLNIKGFKPLAKTKKKRTAKEAICNPPIPKDASNNELTAQSEKVIKRLSYIKEGENVFNAKMPKQFRLKLNSNAEISQIYKRLTADKPAYTITGSGGGGTHVYHWSECRALTNRERARLQTFPDSFVFIGGKEAVRKQIGMAVPPEGARLILKQVLKTLIDNGIKPKC